MRHILLTFLLLFLFGGCNDTEKQIAQNHKIIQETKAANETLHAQLKIKEEALQKAQLEIKATKEKLLAQEQLQKEREVKRAKENEQKQAQTKKNEKLSKVGISLQDNKITIDTNKTKDFFQTIGALLQEKMQKITKEIQTGLIDEKDAGVKIDESHINIDLNKTKNFLEAWGKKMQGFVNEFDTIAKEMDKGN